MTTVTKLITAEELFDLDDVGPCELINGAIVPMAPAGFEHGDIAARLSEIIRAFVRTHKLGKVVAAETGFTIRRNPDLIRAADVAFVGKDRLPTGPVRGYFEGPPDLAVEVVSPSDRWSTVVEKVEQWLATGARSCWVVDPATRIIQVFARDGGVRRCQSGDVLTDELVLPGFAMPVAAAFDADV